MTETEWTLLKRSLRVVNLRTVVSFWL